MRVRLRGIATAIGQAGAGAMIRAAVSIAVSRMTRPRAPAVPRRVRRRLCRLVAAMSGDEECGDDGQQTHPVAGRCDRGYLPCPGLGGDEGGGPAGSDDRPGGDAWIDGKPPSSDVAQVLADHGIRGPDEANEGQAS